MVEQFGKYRGDEIGRGGMGIVYRCVDPLLGRVVAIKVISPESARDPEMCKRFLNEARIQEGLKHDNIVSIIDCFIHQGSICIVMEFIEGETLADRLGQLGRPMSPSEAIPICSHALEGLGFAHARRVIHRDIKPSNIMLTQEGVAKLTDFGIARGLDTPYSTVKGKRPLGTPEYMSPDRIRGWKADPRADIYSMGITLYQMLTGRVPFPRAKDTDDYIPVLTAHLFQHPTPPSELVRGIPVSLEAAILKALEKQPERRFTSCQEFQAALVPSTLPATRKAVVVPVESEPAREKANETAPVPELSPPKPGLRPEPKRVPPDPSRVVQKQKSSRAVIASLVTAVVVIIVAALALVYWRTRQNPPGGPASTLPPPQKTQAAPVGSIRVQTLPGAIVFLDKKRRGSVDTSGELLLPNVSAGSHELRVLANGKKDFRQKVNVSSGQESRIKARLLKVLPPSAGEVRENPKDGMRYVWIPRGTFTMGCSRGDHDCSDNEKPAHRVTISEGFWMGQTEVTVGAYKRFAAATRRQMPDAPGFNNRWENDNMPIVNVTWIDAHDYCTWAGGRLPTEAQWEYAARGGSAEPAYGNLDEIAWYGDNSGNETREVGQKPANDFGLFDMLGNVSEFVSDSYGEDYYLNSPSQDPPGPQTKPVRVLRGGSWSSPAKDVRVSYRNWISYTYWLNNFGVRCVREADDP